MSPKQLLHHKQDHNGKKKDKNDTGNVAGTSPFFFFAFLLFIFVPPIPQRDGKSVKTQITKCSIFAGVIQNQQTVTFSEVCTRVCDPTVNENKCCVLLSDHFVFAEADMEDR